ncbi:MAG: complex I NDUFA9 subunit family protein [Gammaproteobacteria bacterium]|nr:complex I NDUFA9 subunit family protein [Gammaproteobacteria bacterium]NNJ90941.1 complex I NDUFA9 subunit family protein [Gammaproteobacteria bacterium]
MNIRRICILGGTGFVGRHLIPKFASQGIETLVLSRHPERYRQLSLNPGCRVVEANIFDKKQLLEKFQGCDAVVNLVGILNEKQKLDFRRVHVELVDSVTNCCRQAGVKRLLHMSALHASATSGSSQYLRTKGEGENRAHTGGKPDVAVTSFKPSVIFGPDDSFINRFAGVLKIPGPLPLACPDSKFSPVYIEDVCEAMANSLNHHKTFAQRYELCGPQTYSLIEIVRYISTLQGTNKLVFGLSNGLSQLQASILEKLPGKLFTTDNYLSLQQDSVCSDKDYNLLSLGISPTSMDSIVPAMLKQASEKNRYQTLRKVRP